MLQVSIHGNSISQKVKLLKVSVWLLGEAQVTELHGASLHINLSTVPAISKPKEK